MNPIRKSIEIYDAKISFMSLVDRPANRRPFLLTKSEDDPGVYQIAGTGRILNVYSCERHYVNKAESEVSHYVTGVAYEPMVADTDDNYMTAEEIEKMAHWFLKHGCMVDEQHDFEQNFNCHIVESWIATDDTTIGDQPVQKGTWLVKVEVNDDDIWQKIQDGDITGFSVGGLAKFGTEDVDLEQVTQKGERIMEPEKEAHVANDTDEKRSFLAKLAKMFGFDDESEAIRKGRVADQFTERLKCEGFWIALNTLENTLKHYDWHEDKYVFEGDPQAIADALSDFTQIVTALLAGTPDQIATAISDDAQAIEKSAMPVFKAGKKMSTARLNRLKAVQEELNGLVSELSDVDEEEADDEEVSTDEATAEKGSGKPNADDDDRHSCTKEETDMTQEEITSIATATATAVVKAMKDAQTPAAEVEKAAQPTASAAHREPTPAVGLTIEQVNEMIEKAIKKASADELPAEEAAPAYVTMEKAQEMIDAAVSKVKKARGAATSLNEEGAAAVKKDAEADFWANTFVPGN